AVEELLLAIEAAESEVVKAELGMHAQARRFEVRSARLSRRAAGFDNAAEAAPHVCLVRDVDRRDQVRVRIVKGRERAIARLPDSGDAGDGGDLRPETGSRTAHRGPGLRKLCLR